MSQFWDIWWQKIGKPVENKDKINWWHWIEYDEDKVTGFTKRQTFCILLILIRMDIVVPWLGLSHLYCSKISSISFNPFTLDDHLVQFKYWTVLVVVEIWNEQTRHCSNFIFFNVFFVRFCYHISNNTKRRTIHNTIILWTYF